MIPQTQRKIMRSIRLRSFVLLTTGLLFPSAASAAVTFDWATVAKEKND